MSVQSTKISTTSEILCYRACGCYVSHWMLSVALLFLRLTLIVYINYSGISVLENWHGKNTRAASKSHSYIKETVTTELLLSHLSTCWNPLSAPTYNFTRTVRGKVQKNLLLHHAHVQLFNLQNNELLCFWRLLLDL